MIVRLRETVDMDRLYRDQYDHSRWKDHVLRVAVTSAHATWFDNVNSVADLSCGDGVIARDVANIVGASTVVLGDYAPGHPIRGRIEDTINDIDPVDLFICSETLEHVYEPAELLSKIRGKCRYLLLTTPLGETRPTNPEHVWGWDEVGVGELVSGAGFRCEVFSMLRVHVRSGVTVQYQMWVLS